MKKIYCTKPAFRQAFGGGMSFKTLTAAVLVALSLGGASYAAEAPAVAEDLILSGHSEALAEESQNDMSSFASLRMTGNGVATGFAGNIDPDNIGDTLTGTNHVTYSGTDSGAATGSISVKNPDGSSQNIYYTYTAPSGYDTTRYSGRTNNLGTIKNPTGTDSAHSIYGGKVLNNPSGTTTSLEGYLFKDNKTSAVFSSTTSGKKCADLLGGAIYNAGEITRITSDFVANGLGLTLNRTSGYMYGYALGGAIANVGTIGDITGDFIGNYAQSTSYYAHGGAIYNNNATIGDIIGDFIGNYAKSSSGKVWGGAIYNYAEYGTATIGDITGDFIGNYVQVSSSPSSDAEGGAIYNYGSATIGDITGDFIGNYAKGNYTRGGAIYNNGYLGTATIGAITGDFIGNYTFSYSYAHGGAIYNDYYYGTATIGNITGDFIGNYAQSISSDKYSDAEGGAIFNSGIIGDITGDFIGNYAQSLGSSAYGGAIYNYAGTIGNITGDFIGNYAQSSGSSANGGAIYNTSAKGIGLTNNKFLGNYAKSESGTAQGGAIFTGCNLTIKADNGTSEFTGNYVQVGDGEKDYQAIYAAAKTATTTSQSASSLGLSYSGTVYTNGATPPTITFKSENNGSIIMNDKIAAEVAPAYRWNYSSATTSTSAGNKTVYTYRYLDGDYNTTDEYRYWYTSGSTSVGGTSRTVYTYQMLNPDNTDSDKYRYWSTSASTSVDGTSRYVYTYHMLNEDNTESKTYRYWSESSNKIYTYHILDENNNEIKTIKSPSDKFIVAVNNNPITPYETSNSTIAFTGDSTGHVYLNNNIEAISKDNGVTNSVDVTLDNVTLHLGVTDSDNKTSSVLAASNFTANSGIIDTVDNMSVDYTVGKLTSNSNVKYSIDVDLENKTSDRFITSGSSSGTVTIDNVNLLSGSWQDVIDKNLKIQVIKTQNGSLQLKLGDNLNLPADKLLDTIITVKNDDIKNNIKWDDVFETTTTTKKVYGTVGLGTTETTNDSIAMVIKNVIQSDKSLMGDTLQLWNQYDTTAEKNFTFDTVTDRYTATANVGETKGNVLNINGVIDSAGNRSTIDFNGKSGFEVNNQAVINVKNVNLENSNGSVVAINNEDSTLNLTNVNIKNNTAQNAIYSQSNVNLKADGANVELSGNSGNAVYLDNADKTLTMTVVNRGTVTQNNSIDGVAGYNVKFTGDSTGKIQLNNGIKNANVTLDTTTLHLGVTDSDNKTSSVLAASNFTANSGIIDTVDNMSVDYTVGKLTSNSNVKYSIDVDLDNKTSDRFITSGSSSGTVTIDNVNLLSGSWQDVIDNNLKIQVIKTQNGSLQLKLGDNLNLPADKLLDTIITVTNDDIKNNIKWNDVFETKTTTKKVYGTVGLGTTETTNDSIAMVIKNVIQSDTSLIGDTLQLWNQYDTTAEKNFTFDTATDRYTATANVGETKGNVLNINGVINSAGNRSTIDFNRKSGFEVNNQAVINVKNVNLENSNGSVVAINNEDSTLNLTNVNIKNNTAQNAIYSQSNVNLKADGANVELSGNSGNAVYLDNADKTLTMTVVNRGTITQNNSINGASGYNVKLTGDSTGKIQLNNGIKNANVTLDTTTLQLGVTDSGNNKSDVLAQSNVTVNSGVVDTVDGKYTNYTINKLNSSENARYSIDMVLSSDEQKSDTFTLTEGGSGTVYLSSINVIQPAQDDYNTYIIQIIKSATDNAPQLAYDDSKVMKLATANMTSDTILADGFGLYTTGTLNDSIVVKNMRDVFSEWANLDATEDKTFTFVNGSSYTLSEDSALKGNIISIVGSGNNFDVNNKEFLDNVASNQKVSISGLNITNSNQVNNNGELTLQNSTLSADIINSGTLNLQNKTSVGNITNNSDVVVLNLEKNSTVESVSGSGNLAVKNSDVTFISGLSGQNISAENSTMTFNNLSLIQGNNLSMTNSSLNTLNLGLNNLHFNDFSMTNSNINIQSVDVDLANATMGRISADNYGQVSGNINVNSLNIISKTEKLSQDVLFADSQLAGNVRYNGAKTVAYSPIYAYDVSYKQNSSDGRGYFNFVRFGIGSNNTSDGFNPAVLSTGVSTQGSGKVTMSNTLSASFEHADNFMNMDAGVRFALLNSNSYAMNNGDKLAFSSTDFNENLNHIDVNYANKGVWVKPYTSFESINLKNGPIVDLISYGTLIGADSDFKKLKHGWYNVGTAYIGYNGSNLSYSNVDSVTNGGTLGLTETFYKGNLWTAITASVGAGVTSTNTMYGHEESTMLMAGAASKTGYNFEFKQGRLIIQPRMQVSYSMVNTFDYKNAAGVKIESDPLHTIQLYPSLRVIGNINGWQPYATVGVVWNALNSSNVTANGVKLPEMSIKPYAEYGLGLQHCWKDKYSAYAQALLRSGGRNGIALTFGFRWALGKDNTAKLLNDSNTRKSEIKKSGTTKVSATEKKVKVNTQETKAQKVTALKAKLQIGSDQHGGAKHVLKEAKKPLNHKISTLEED